MLYINLLIFILCIQTIVSVQVITIGAAFESDKNYNKSIQMLQYAINEANEKILSESGLKLAMEDQKLTKGREFAISKNICYLMELGLGALFGPKSLSFAYHAMNICDGKEIPYISTYMDEDAASKRTVLNMHPSQSSLVQLLIDVINASGWRNIGFLYESPEWLTRVTRILEANNKSGIRFYIRNLNFTVTNEFQSVLREIRELEIGNIVLDCSIEALPLILKQAMQVGLMTKQYRWIITNLDANSLDLDQLRYGGTNITTFQIINENHLIFDKNPIIGEETPEEMENFDEIIDDSMFPNSRPVLDDIMPTYPEKFINKISLPNALIYDAVMVYATAIQELGVDQVTTKVIDCHDSSSTWNHGFTIINYMKNIKYTGLTGDIEFDNDGVRSSVSIDILELSEDGLETVATWKRDSPIDTDRITSKRRYKEPKSNPIDDYSLRNKTLIVITALADPYTMLKDSSESLIGNDRFEGYAIDLIFELSLLLEFNYIFLLQEDGNYGTCVNNITNEWNGMIGEVISGRADIAITDLTVTSERIRALDFTPAIMNLGIAIMYQVPRKQPPSTFSFMAPFANEVWIVLGLTYVTISIIFYCLGRISPSQWENPYPCIEEPTYLQNQFSFQNAFWFAAGALLQQGSEIEVKAPSVRVASAVWWFFTLIMVSSYTANLAAFLVAENRVTVIESVEDFKACGLPGQPKCKATFGAKKGGSTLNFFRDSKYETFQNMYNVMKNNPDVLVEENHEGLSRVQNENYAYLMESTSLLYYTERNCDVTMVGSLIDDRNYAIGMRKNYKYYNTLSEGVLRLQERGVMDKLHTKWWKAKRGGGACQKKEATEAESLDIDHLEGVFVILTYGSFAAFVYGAFDAIRIIRKRARKAKISFRRELKVEFRFLLKSLLDPDKPKPVRLWKHRTLSITSNASDPPTPNT